MKAGMYVDRPWHYRDPSSVVIRGVIPDSVTESRLRMNVIPVALRSMTAVLRRYAGESTALRIMALTRPWSFPELSRMYREIQRKYSGCIGLQYGRP